MDHDEAREQRSEAERAAEVAENERPARPEQVEEGFATGYDQARDTPEEELEPNFARGISREEPGGGRHGRFSDGAEELPDSPEKDVERRFSQGIERSPTSD